MIDQEKLYLRAIAITIISASEGSNETNPRYLRDIFNQHANFLPDNIQLDDEDGVRLLAMMEEAQIVSPPNRQGMRYVNGDIVKRILSGPWSNETMRAIKREIDEIVQKFAHTRNSGALKESNYSHYDQELQSEIDEELQEVMYGPERKRKEKQERRQAEALYKKIEKSASKRPVMTHSVPEGKSGSSLGGFFKWLGRKPLIGSAEIKGGFLSIRSESGWPTGTISVGKDASVMRFTESEVMVRTRGAITTYDCRGNRIRYVAAS
jgi:hypothetical protein